MKLKRPLTLPCKLAVLPPHPSSLGLASTSDYALTWVVSTTNQAVLCVDASRGESQSYMKECEEKSWSQGLTPLVRRMHPKAFGIAFGLI